MYHFGAIAERQSMLAPTPLPQYVHRMTEWLMGAQLSSAEERGFPRWLYKAIDRMELIHAAVAIWKRAPPRAIRDSELDQLEELVARARPGNGWLHVARLLLVQGHVDRAERASRHAIEVQPNRWETHTRLADVLQHKGDVDGAIAALEAAIALGGANRLESLRERVAKLHQNRKPTP
jgi:tetratricopeptide (TPR) repeat protein